MATWRDRGLALRDRVLADPRFQRWAARFPLTRPIAERRATALFDLCAGFVYSQVLFACVHLGLLEALAEHGPSAPSELARTLQLSRGATERLLDAAADLALVERRSGNRWGLGKHGTSYVGNPGIAAMVRHHALLYRDLADPIALLRGAPETELRRFWDYTPDADEGAVAAYSRLMADSLGLLAEDVIEAWPLRGRRHLIDLGGGLGVFVEHASRHAPDLALTLFDLPPVAAQAERRLAACDLERIQVVGGDLFVDPLPGPADVVSLVRVLHDHDDEGALQILRAARRALEPGGTLLVAEPMRGTRGAEPVGAYFTFYLLAMGQGRPRSAEEVRALMHEAGFRAVEPLRTRRPMLTRLVVGRA
ncbi:MAG TPA: methyltransferase [Polyangiaceae bacterium LLY-WYZ-15_(1-7)]|nr:methyltransferase [Sandaracinus sp.]HJL04123.1 methyltransferase [Polyangiaceae bacterium LLY-WYZ-15_(1-7)]HJL09639.1 methyltransferase [Polyangiaceae bacterium LLY-WYZ-15_(1-7)]HJL32018.1 methyltransferase [Polyangiaceae bacterium LLY-WYZ-15_(1-7)]HJL36021.1 methyltransferase [Polyangiaceae bacterium LLY-WYZ-15_(1-7)]